MCVWERKREERPAIEKMAARSASNESYKSRTRLQLDLSDASPVRGEPCPWARRFSHPEVPG